MNMKSKNKFSNLYKGKEFNLELEAKLVQARFLSPIIEFIKSKKITQTELKKKTGLSQSFLSNLFNGNKKVNIEHIALLQNALGIVLQPPDPLTNEEHYAKFYENSDIPSNKNYHNSQNVATMIVVHREMNVTEYNPLLRKYG